MATFREDEGATGLSENGRSSPRDSHAHEAARVGGIGDQVLVAGLHGPRGTAAGLADRAGERDEHCAIHARREIRPWSGGNAGALHGHRQVGIRERAGEGEREFPSDGGADGPRARIAQERTASEGVLEEIDDAIEVEIGGVAGDGRVVRMGAKFAACQFCQGAGVRRVSTTSLPVPPA